MRRACIDIGSNTTRLLVADDAGAGLVVVCEERAYTRIGVDMAGGDTISDGKCDEVTEVVAAQLERARARGAAEVHGVATAAIRHAANGAELVTRLRAETGLEVTVLSGAQEARLAFRGATGMLATTASSQWLGVLDVGGGSSEVVIGRAGTEIDWWVSLPVGSGVLSVTHMHHDPPTASELAAARAQLAAATERIAWDGPHPARVLAVGGSATSLCRLAGARLDAAALRRALGMLTARPAERIAAEHGIDPARARLLPAGLVILDALAARMGGVVEVVRGGIREGVLLEAVAR